MVKYEIQAFESMILLSIMAFVGQASIQAVQLPQWSVVGASGSISKEQIISAKKKKLPTPLRINKLCLPTQPKPDFSAHYRSITGAESTKTRPSTVGSRVLMDSNNKKAWSLITL